MLAVRLLMFAEANGDECVVQRYGKDCAVIVNIRQWRRRSIGQRLDALGPDYRLSEAKQARDDAEDASKKAKASEALTVKAIAATKIAQTAEAMARKTAMEQQTLAAKALADRARQNAIGGNAALSHSMEGLQTAEKSRKCVAKANMLKP